MGNACCYKNSEVKPQDSQVTNYQVNISHTDIKKFTQITNNTSKNLTVVKTDKFKSPILMHLLERKQKAKSQANLITIL